MLRTLSVERADIRDAMAFALDNAESGGFHVRMCSQVPLSNMPAPFPTGAFKSPFSPSQNRAPSLLRQPPRWWKS